MKRQATHIGFGLCALWTLCATPAIAQDVIDAEEVGDATQNPTQDRAGQVPSTAGAAVQGDGEEVTSGGEDVDTTPASQAPPVSGEQTIGPGGRPMRTDYPGTEEALRPRMQTDRIQGIATGDESSKEVYDLRVKELETRIDDLKDQVFRSKSRIVLLKETLLGNNLAGTKAMIVHKNELGKSFKLKRLTYVLDGTPLRNELDRDGNLADKQTIEILNGPLGPGTHNLIVQLEYQGSAAVFDYFEGYTLKLDKQCKFTVEEGKVTIVDVVTYKDGGATERVDQAAALRCDQSKTELTKDQ